MASGFSASGPSAQDEKQLAYVASQIGVPSAPSPVSAVLDKATGEVVAVVIISSDGTKYIGKVAPGQPSKMVLEARGGDGRKGGVYVLSTRYEKIDLANRRQVESIFRMSDWESTLQRL